MSDFTKMTEQELKALVEKAVDSKLPPGARAFVGNQINDVVKESAETLHKTIQKTVKENPTLTGEALTTKISTDFQAALPQNPEFMQPFTKLQQVAGGELTIPKVVELVEEKVLKPNTLGAVTPATSPTPPSKPAPLHEKYSEKNAVAVSRAVADTPGIPQYNSAELDKILTTTMVDGKRYLPDAIKNKKPDDPVLQLWDSLGLGEIAEMLQKFLMKMFMGKDGDVYEAASESGQAMFDAANAIRMSGPGEGVFENYQSSQSFKGEDGKQRTIGVQDLQHIAILNSKIREAGGKDTEEGKKLVEQREQFAQKQFGINSDAVWAVFQQDKQNLTVAVLDKMGVEARANGLIDTPNGEALYQGFLGAVDSKRGNAAVPELLKYNRNNIKLVIDPETGKPVLDQDGNPVFKTVTGVTQQSIDEAKVIKEQIAQGRTDIKITTPPASAITDSPKTVEQLTLDGGNIPINTTSSAPLQGATPATNNIWKALQNCGSLNLGLNTNPDILTGFSQPATRAPQTQVPVRGCF